MNEFCATEAEPTGAWQRANPKSDIEISQTANKRPILDIARERLGKTC
jgi:hypothetical protein